MISSRIAGSSIVAGIFHVTPSAIARIVPLRILPDLVFGSLSTTMTVFEGCHRSDLLPHQTDQLCLNLCPADRSVPALSTTNPMGS